MSISVKEKRKTREEKIQEAYNSLNSEQKVEVYKLYNKYMPLIKKTCRGLKHPELIEDFIQEAYFECAYVYSKYDEERFGYTFQKYLINLYKRSIPNRMVIKDFEKVQKDKDGKTLKDERGEVIKKRYIRNRSEKAIGDITYNNVRNDNSSQQFKTFFEDYRIRNCFDFNFQENVYDKLEKTMTEREKTVFLRRQGNVKYKDIAKELNVSYATVCGDIWRMKNRAVDIIEDLKISRGFNDVQLEYCQTDIVDYTKLNFF